MLQIAISIYGWPGCELTITVTHSGQAGLGHVELSMTELGGWRMIGGYGDPCRLRWVSRYGGGETAMRRRARRDHGKESGD